MAVPHCIQHHTFGSPKEEQTFDERVWNTISDTEAEQAIDADDEKQILLLKKALEKLTADEQALVTLFYEEEKTVADICYILHLTEIHVKVKLHRILKKLYLLMKQEDQL